MRHAVEAAYREELRQAGLPSQGLLPHLLALLRQAPETHLGVADIALMAAEAGLAITPSELARQLDVLADHDLLGRLPTTTAEQVFDTIPQSHFHLLYEDAAQVVDLHVSPDTLLEMLRRALAERPEDVEVLVRFRRGAGGRGSAT